MSSLQYTPVIGLEVHVQLKTKTKIFCGCGTTFGARPNSQVCPVCLGFPGVLPVLNRKVLQFGIRVALGLGCQIQRSIAFHRKNYFYPDLPKNFQISQYDLPLGRNGSVEVGERRIRVHRAHLEEDAGKLIHQEAQDASLVDFNRAGMPLLEIVSEPDITSAQEAQAYLKILKATLMYLEVSDCDMEKGTLRCDVNVSLTPVGSVPREGRPVLGTKVEIKNLNSFKAVGLSLQYEIARQTRLLEEAGKVTQETRLWDDVKGVTLSMRSKEFAHDYRYFPEPDLAPFTVSPEEIAEIEKTLPELPGERAPRFEKEYGLSAMDAKLLTAMKGTADYYEETVGLRKGSGKGVANWILGEISREMNEQGLDDIRALSFSPRQLIELIELVDSGRVSHTMAKEVFVVCLKDRISPAEVVKSQNLSQVTDRDALKQAAMEVIEQNAKAAEDFRKGKEQSLMFLVGQLMRRTKGAASPAISQEVLRNLLEGKTV